MAKRKQRIRGRSLLDEHPREIVPERRNGCPKSGGVRDMLGAIPSGPVL